jgi:hypothetical protein
VIIKLGTCACGEYGPGYAIEDYFVCDYCVEAEVLENFYNKLEDNDAPTF